MIFISSKRLNELISSTCLKIRYEREKSIKLSRGPIAHFRNTDPGERRLSCNVQIKAGTFGRMGYFFYIERVALVKID